MARKTRESRVAMKRTLIALAVGSLVASGTHIWASDAPSVPILYTTDLYHPADDPDDHFDLLTLFAIPEFDIRGIVIDAGPRGKDRPALAALRQVMHMTGRTVPFAVGLDAPLRHPEDTAEDQRHACQDGVWLILDVLREAASPVTMFITGSLRDVAAAYNREPDLFRGKAGRIYVNAGWYGNEMEWNVTLDPHAYVRILRSGLPVYWAPCFGDAGYATYWKFRHADLLGAVSKPVRNFVLYMLTQADAATGDPLAYLNREPDAGAVSQFWPQERNMWCTGPLLHAAGRATPACSFGPVSVALGPDGSTRPDGDGEKTRLLTFHVDDPAAYPEAMASALRELLVQFPLAAKEALPVGGATPLR